MQKPVSAITTRRELHMQHIYDRILISKTFLTNLHANFRIHGGSTTIIPGHVMPVRKGLMSSPTGRVKNFTCVYGSIRS